MYLQNIKDISLMLYHTLVDLLRRIKSKGTKNEIILENIYIFTVNCILNILTFLVEVIKT